MKILGFDFTSAPNRKKPITCAACTLHNNLLHLENCLKIYDFADFESMLRQQGPWLAALDFPFSLPRKLLVNLGWPETWADYVQLVSLLGKAGFEDMLSQYIRTRSPGDKLHLRETDRYAGARSPMMLQRVPVAKMFFQGAPRLLASGASVLPCHPLDDKRIAVEGYPALVARALLGKSSYKSDELQKQTQARASARQAIVAGLRSEALLASYGFALELSDDLADALLADPSADELDALLCAIQGAWAYAQRHNNYGIPLHCLSNEGWIVDPAVQLNY